MKHITSRKNINEVVNETIYQFPSIQFNSKLGERVKEVGLNQTELSLLTGIRYSSVNDLMNNKKVTLNLQHVLAIMVALRLKSFDDLFSLSFDDAEDAKRFDTESLEYRDKGLPDSTLAKIEENRVRLGR